MISNDEFAILFKDISNFKKYNFRIDVQSYTSFYN